MNPKITILVPCYNKEKYLKHLFKSLKNQRDKNFSIIFLDDCSNDDTYKMLLEFKQQCSNLFNIKIIKLKNNMGVANARNVLIKNAKTQYFYFLDPDDHLTKNAIYFFNEKIKESKYNVILSKERLTFYHTPIVPNVLSNFTFFKIKAKKYNSMSLAWLENTTSFVWNKAIKTKWFKTLDTNFNVGTNYEDLPFMSEVLLRSNNVGYINKITYWYNLNFDGLTRKHDPKKFRDIFSNLESLYQFLEKNNLIYDWRHKSKIEEFTISKLFVHLFYLNKQNKKTLINFEEYQESLSLMFEFLEKYQVDLESFKLSFIRQAIYRSSLRNYKKIKVKFYKYKNYKNNFLIQK